MFLQAEFFKIILKNCFLLIFFELNNIIKYYIRIDMKKSKTEKIIIGLENKRLYSIEIYNIYFV